jgi:peptide deformylase
MAVRKILLYTQDAAALREKSRPVGAVSRGVRRLIRDLEDTLAHSSDGMGLAAPPIALIDPEIVEAGDEEKDLDGCLSFPGLYGEENLVYARAQERSGRVCSKLSLAVVTEPGQRAGLSLEKQTIRECLDRAVTAFVPSVGTGRGRPPGSSAPKNTVRDAAHG